MRLFLDANVIFAAAISLDFGQSEKLFANATTFKFVGRSRYEKRISD